MFLIKNAYAFSFLENLYVFYTYLLLLENWMCSSTFSFSWKIGCVLAHFAAPGKFDVFLQRNYVRKTSPPGYSYVFFLYLRLLETLMCSRNFEKKLLLEKKNRYFTKIARRLLLIFVCIPF